MPAARGEGEIQIRREFQAARKTVARFQNRKDFVTISPGQ